MTTTARHIELLEYQAAGEKFRVDRKAGVIRGVKLVGLESSNFGGKRRYNLEVLRRARSLYEGAPVYIDHVSDPSRAAVVRGQRDHWGEVRDVAEGKDGLYGDIHYLRTHSQTEEILERAERFPKRVACSHSARAAVEHRQGYEFVTDIELVRSVDLVTQPATTKTLFESANHEEKTMLLQDIIAGLSTERRALRSVQVIESAIAAKPKIGQLSIEVQEADTADAVRACLVAATAELVESQSDDEAADRLAALLPQAKPKTQAKELDESHKPGSGQGDNSARFLKELDVRDALLRHGLTKIDVDAKRIETLEACSDLKSMVDTVATWTDLVKPQRSAAKPDNPGSKLRRVLLESEEEDRHKSYDELRKELVPAKAK